MEVITSRQNQHYRKLNDLHKRDHRDSAGLFLVEGKNELLLAKEIETLYFAEMTPFIEEIQKKARNVILMSKELLESISYRGEAVAICKANLSSFAEIKNKTFLLACESIEKPGNLGGILRTADSVGVEGVIVADPIVDVFNPNVVRASLGALFCLPIVQTDSESALQFLEKENLQILVTTPKASTLYHEIDLTKPSCIVIGSESEGLSSHWLKYPRAVPIKIPMRGHVDSLNASISASIILYETLRQRSTLSR